MRELEEVNTEIRKVIDIQSSVLNRLTDFPTGNNEQYSTVEEKINVNSSRGGFLNDATYAWLSHEHSLVIFSVKTGESVSSWTFKEKITCVSQFPAQPGEIPILLVGLSNDAPRIKDSYGMLCVFDCGRSRVLRAITMPAGVQQVCIVSGGSEREDYNEKGEESPLSEMDGVACVVLRNLYHILIDLQRSSWDSFNSIIMDESLPAEMELCSINDSAGRSRSSDRKHVAFNLFNKGIERQIGFNGDETGTSGLLRENRTSAVMSCLKIGYVISGCWGRVIMWQNDGTIAWISPPVDDALTVTHLALLEPTDDPRPFYYLCVILQNDAGKLPPLVRMYALLFDRKYCDRGSNSYCNLEAEPSLKFEFELDANDRVISLSTIERETSLDQSEAGTKRDECNLLLISTIYKTLLFDLNQWYKEQMPQSVCECQNPNSILACYRTRSLREIGVQNEIVGCTYMPSTLQEFPNNSPAAAEELFYPNSLSLEWIELRTKKLTFWASRGIQSELLRDMAIAGPIFLSQPTEMFQRCLSAGLVPFNVEVSFMSDQDTQRDMLLSLCLEQRWTTFLIKCAKDWSDGSATYLYPAFLKWGVQRASTIKMVADHICVPLFDQSGNNIGESDVKSLRFCSQQLECLSNVVAKLPFEKGEFIKQRRALKRISMYFQVLLWFYDVGLLPESQDLEEGPLPMSLAFRVPYPFLKLDTIYKEKRDSMKVPEAKQESENLFIDELIMRECPVLRQQWEKEADDVTNNGYYPPPSLQSLLRSYLVDCCQSESNEMEYKHQITIYLLMDLAMLLQGSYPGVDQLIKYPSAFKMSPSIIKLTQAFWLLDHEDYQGFLDIMTGQLVSDFDIKDWHHKLVVRTLVRRNQHKLTLIYLRIRKPPLESVEDRSILVKLSVQHGLVQSAFHQRPPSHYTQLLINFFEACKAYGKLSDILHLSLDMDEEEIFIKFLEKTESSDMRLLYYLQRCRYTEANNGKLLSSHGFVHPKEVQNPSQAMLNAYNTTLPDIVKRFSINMMKNHFDADIETRCPRPMSHFKSRNKTTSLHENVIRKARETYLRSEKHQIPFISAPCVSLRSSENQPNDDCVLLPKFSEKSNKRTLGQIYERDNDSLQMPETTKRRKLEDCDMPDYKDIELNTPLVKPKSNATNNRDICTGTPQSILKIRQMIRSSTSPTVSSSCQINSQNSPLHEKEKKSARQIRFSLGQPRNSPSKSPSKEESIVQEVSDSNMQVSAESEGTYFSPNITPGSCSETAILSDTSYCKTGVYSPRPRSSLRRICFESSKDSLGEPVNKFLRRASLANASIKTPSKKKLSDTPNKLKPAVQDTSQTSPVSIMEYTPSILSDDNSFDAGMVLKRREMQQSLIISNDRTKLGFTVVSSTPLVSGSARKQPEENSINLDMSMDVKDEQKERNGLPVASQQQDSREPRQSEHPDRSVKEDSPHQNRTYQNGDVAKNSKNSNNSNNSGNSPGNAESAYAEDMELSVEEEEEAENEDEFQSLSSVTESSRCSDRKDRFSWHKEITETVSITKSVSIKQNVDITDDESSNSENDMVLALEESNGKCCASTSPKERPNLYEPPNITDDESEPEIPVSKLENNIKTRRNGKSNRSSKVVENETSEVGSTLGENNSRNVAGTSRRRATRMNRGEEANKTLQENHISVTRSRRASSVTKNTVSSATLDSPKATARTKSSPKADSSMNEVFGASASIGEDNPNQTNTAESKDLATIAPQGKGRGRRTVSITKENTSPDSMESPSKMPVRRSTRRAASVQKELTIEAPESPKRLTKKSRVSSTSSLVSERNEEFPNNEKKTNKGKSSTSTVKKAGTTRSSKLPSAEESQEAVEERQEEEAEPEMPVKRSRKRGSSMPKQVVPETTRTRRSASLAKEVISEASPTGLGTPKKNTVKQVDAINSPAANTRSRRSSIQSIPEELEEILSISSKERVTGARKQAAKGGTRQRRAASVEPLQAEKKPAPRNTRNRRIVEDPIAEEEVFEAEDQNSSKASNAEKSLSIQNYNATVTKGKSRRSKTGQQAADGMFLFSEPRKTDDVPPGEKCNHRRSTQLRVFTASYKIEEKRVGGPLRSSTPALIKN